MAYTLTPKPTGTYTGVDKFTKSYLLYQGGGFLTFQGGNKIVIKTRPTDNYTKVGKT